MKKIMITLLLFIVLLGSWTIYSINHPPKWNGTSNDQKWETVYKPDGSPHGTWEGLIIWHGDHPVQVSRIKLVKNGNRLHSWESEGQTVTPGSSTHYLVLGRPFINEDDEYVVTIHWSNEGERHVTEITLEPKTRFFVNPF